MMMLAGLMMNVVGYIIFMPQDILQNVYLTLGTVGVKGHWGLKDPIRLKGWHYKIVNEAVRPRSGCYISKKGQGGAS